MNVAKKYFTLDEANRLLPAIRTELESLQEIKRQFEAKYAELQRMRERHGGSDSPSRGAAGGSGRAGSDGAGGIEGDAGEVGIGGDPFFVLECEIEFLQIEAKGLIQSIYHKGAELKDIEQGLIDFPALIDGEEVLLCWKQGEERIEYYHGLHDGYSGRKRIEG
jgi:hypothetical protein